MIPKSKPNLEQIIGDKYLVDRKIGEGGFCIVLKALDKTNRKVVAIKRTEKTKDVYKKMKGHDSNVKINYLMMKEINIMKALEHRNLMKLIEFIEENDNIYLVLEFAEGGELFNRIIKRNHIPEDESRNIIKQVISGVMFMHEKGFVHRDIKAENILFAKKGVNQRIIIADFGLSRKTIDIMHTNCGTVNYSAPELILNKTTKNGYNYKVDNWSIGVLTYFTLCGSLPFNYPNQNENDIKRQVISGKFSFSKSPWHKISKAAKDFISNLLIRNSSLRLELQEAMDHYWISQVEMPNLEKILIYPRMENALNTQLNRVRWKVLIYLNLTIIHFCEICPKIKDLQNISSKKQILQPQNKTCKNS